MLKNIRNSAFSKILWGFMGIYLLNFSVDTEDSHPNCVSENLSFNDQESIVEIFIEKVLGFENYIEEYDDNDSEDYHAKSITKINFITHTNPKEKTELLGTTVTKLGFYFRNGCIKNGFQKIATPPPQLYFF